MPPGDKRDGVVAKNMIGLIGVGLAVGQFRLIKNLDALSNFQSPQF
jgi:hypothetical protein